VAAPVPVVAVVIEEEDDGPEPCACFADADLVLLVLLRVVLCFVDCWSLEDDAIDVFRFRVELRFECGRKGRLRTRKIVLGWRCR